MEIWRHTKDRPDSVTDFFDDGLDKVRSIAYHEFGHHLHQMKYVNNDINYGAFKKQVLDS